MKKIMMLTLFVCLNTSAFAQSMNDVILSSLKGVKSAIEGKKGTIVLTPFENTQVGCADSKLVDSRASSTLAGLGIKTSLASRALSKDADQAEISRVAKLSGGSFILKGSYSVIGNKFTINCTLMDHNGNGVGACNLQEAVELNPEEVKSLSCLEVKNIKESSSNPISVEEKTGIDEYICSVIRPNYDLKKLVVELHKREWISLDEMSETAFTHHSDATGSRLPRCVELGSFILCGDFWEDSLVDIYSEKTQFGKAKIQKWLNYEKENIKGHEKCLKAKNKIWNK